MNEKPQIFESYKINHVCNKLLFYCRESLGVKIALGSSPALECLGGNCDLTQHE